ncbi:MAG TPA: serine hydrolase, partial [Chitinophagaceae bacterium]|nr:serine hydrolase [Chitinophagaceae bacterium]
SGIQSLLAGNDMMCLPADISGTIKGVLDAIKKEKLDKDDIEARVKKVLLAKYHLGLNNVQPINIDGLTKDLNAAIPALRKEIAEHALTVVKLTHPRLLPLHENNNIAYIAIGTNKANKLASLLKENENADVFYFDYKADANDAGTIIQSLKEKYGEVIIGVHGLSKYPKNNFGVSNAAIQLVQRIQQMLPTVTMVFGNPYSLKNFCTAPNLVACYEDDSIFQQAAYGWLTGKFSATGTLPVSVCDFKYGTGIVNAQMELEFSKPETQALNSTMLDKIDSIANAAIQQHATPGCVVLALKNGKIVFNRAYGFYTYNDKQPVTTESVYDLASVTKISATTVAVMKLYEQGLLDLKKTLGDYLPWVRESNKANLVIENILLHQAGLVAFIPFYKETIDSVTGIPMHGFYQPYPDSIYTIPVAADMYMRKDWRDTIYQRILQSSLGAAGKYVYSDNDFIFLGKIVEQLSGKTLNEYVYENFYAPMQMSTTGFIPGTKMGLDKIVPTESEKFFRLQLLDGYVHDPGAAMFGNVAGHAGLFSDAYDLAKLYQMLLNGGELNGKRFLKKETIDFFTAYQSNISRRGLGFDKPEKDNATRKEPYPCKSASPETFGHTGYTGTCVWVDPKENLVYIFLSNRVNPDGGLNTKLSDLSVRGSIMEMIYKSMVK